LEGFVRTKHGEELTVGTADPLTRIDLAPVSARRRLWLVVRQSCQGMNVSLVLLLLCIPLAIWGAAIACALRPDWASSITPAFRLSTPIYLGIAASLTAARGWLAARELFVASALLVLAVS
jgi:hypothetical protein